MLEAFAAGVGGKVVHTSAQRLEAGAAAFYGVRPAWQHLWHQARKESRNWYYLDNSWFDASREEYFRVGFNRLQTWSDERSSGKRLEALGVKVRPWRKSGGHIVICRQSNEFMQCVAGWPGGASAWEEHVLRQLKRYTDRMVVIRDKGAPWPLARNLKNAWLLVTHSSAAAIEALANGVPVIVTDYDCAAAGFSTAWHDVEAPELGDGREDLLARLADSQWTLEELRSGAAWRE